ncbi:hypothetical protein O181_114816 [Austropuccinia psidii MF-1]|uniref:Uncharacterized protein n=1 Tax=Austropuccinia psidii MF-1 TaxID=1389203 RepID=A0A9Q3K6W9_9BASI|nr:hypothetical protein [Austropuccinia psidii MF-1]
MITINQDQLTQQIICDYKRLTRHQFTMLPATLPKTHTGDGVNPTSYYQQHWEELNHLMGYLGQYPSQPLAYPKKETGLTLVTDASWGGEHERSTSGYLVHCFGNVLAWSSRRKKVFALSTCAAEYVALVDGTQLLACLHTLLEPLVGHLPLSINFNNKAAVLIAEDNLSKKQMKYLDRAFTFVNNFVRQFNLKLNWMPTINQSSDALMKVLGSVKIAKARGALNLINQV